VRRGTARGSGRRANNLAELLGAVGGRDLESTSPRVARPTAATKPANLAKKLLREQCGFTGTSIRRDQGRKEKKRNGFRDVNHILPGCQKARGIISRQCASIAMTNHKRNAKKCGPAAPTR